MGIVLNKLEYGTSLGLHYLEPLKHEKNTGSK